jgi:hypothetical protein
MLFYYYLQEKRDFLITVHTTAVLDIQAIIKGLLASIDKRYTATAQDFIDTTYKLCAI